MRRLALAGVVVIAAVLAASGSGAVRKASPACSSTYLATWSPDGTQMAFVGRNLGHGPLPLRGICVANSDGTQAAPLAHTVCSRICKNDLIESSTQLIWAQPDLLFYGDDYRIFAISPGAKPRPLGQNTTKPSSYEQFSVDAAGDRIAAGFSSCVQCAGPITIIDVPSGKVIGRVGGKKVDNVTASISPDGTQVVFARYTTGDSTHPLGLWIASLVGKHHLHRLKAKGAAPLFSPDGTRIAYRARPGTWDSLRVVAAGGGKSKVLVAHGAWDVYGWSPDGRQIAFERGRDQRLALVDVATGKVRTLLKIRFGASVSWSADSKELLVRTQPKRNNQCADLWRVFAGGGKPQLLRSC